MKRSLSALLILLFSLASCAAPGPSAPPPEGTLSVHFLDVGQADAALLLCGGEAMLIDGGNVADGSYVVSYLAEQGVTYLDYVVCTHAHEDHAGGLSGALSAYPAGRVLSPVEEYDSKAFRDFLSCTQARGLSPEAPEPDESFPLGEATVTVLGPREDDSETNNTSIVLRVDFGETAFLFTGDMERDAEAGLLEAGCELDATVLKVGHHGSDTSTSYPFLREVLPQYAVVSVGEDNTYGHPDPDTLSRLYDAGCTVYRTDLLGAVVAVSDGETVSFTTEKRGQPEAGRDQVAEQTYVGNQKSRVFHLESCPSLPAEQNRVLFGDRAQAAQAGYRPCGTCKP